jgi:hypothetical protein
MRRPHLVPLSSQVKSMLLEVKSISGRESMFSPGVTMLVSR